MHVDSRYTEYWKMKREYEKDEREVPYFLAQAYESQVFVDQVWRVLYEFADGNVVSKDEWSWLKEVADKNLPEIIAENQVVAVQRTISELSCLKNDLESDLEKFFIDGYTLTRDGRKYIRKTGETIARQSVNILTDAIKRFNREKQEAYEAYVDRLSMPPCVRILTEEEIEQLKAEGRI